MACSPKQVAALWQSLMQHQLSPERLAAFLEHDAMSGLTKFELADLETAAHRVKAAHASGYLLLDHWLGMASGLKVQRSTTSSQTPRRTPRQRGSSTSAKLRRLGLTRAKEGGSRSLDAAGADHQLRANRLRWNGPRKPWEPM